MSKHLTIAALLLLSTPAFAANAPYIFTSIADSTGPFASFYHVALNNLGQVAFGATLDDSSSGIYFASTSIAPTALSNTGDPILGTATITSYGNDVDINDAGTVLFQPNTSTSVSTIAARSTSSPFLLYANAVPSTSGLAINNNGLASFFVGSSFPVSVMTSDGASSTTLASANAVGNGFTSINNKGAVAFNGGSAIYSTASGTPVPLLDRSGPYNQFLGVAENNNNLIATVTQLDDGSYSVVTLDPAGHLSTIASVSPDRFVNPRFRFLPSINDAGEVLFAADGFSGHSGIYTGSDPLNDKVIAFGDYLFNNQVLSFNSSNEALNNSGQIAFNASLTNGVNYVILASPASPGDANADGHVDLSDLSTILNNFGKTSASWTDGNFDNQPTINLTDLSFVLNNFGQLNPGASTSSFSLQPSAFSNAPEPTTLSFTLAAATVLITRRRSMPTCPSQCLVY